uniref:Odorant receptor n=1 Tax=Anopheles farauti TaxID=69004 RepID=A0A182Q8W5_9DIPT
MSMLYRKLIASEEQFAKDRNPFAFAQYIATCYGIRYDPTAGVFHTSLWFSASVLFLVLSYGYKAYWSLTHTAHNLSLFLILCIVWELIGTVIRCKIFYRPVLVRLERFLADRSFRGDEAVYRTARSLVQRQNNRYLVAVIFILVLETAIFVRTNLINQLEFMLVFNNTPVGGLAVQTLYGCVTCYVGSMYLINFAIISVILNMFCVEMAILVNSFGRIDECFDRYRSVWDEPVRSVAREQAFFDKLQSLFKMNVQRHVELLEHLAQFRSILGPFSFIQYYGTFVVIAFFCSILTNDGITKLTVIYFIFMILLVLESYMFCHRMDNLNYLHTQIGSTLYELNWYSQLRYSVRFASQYRQIRKTMLIIMVRAQKPLSFTINGFGTISMRRFEDLMHSSYSLLTLLLQLKKRGLM